MADISLRQKAISYLSRREHSRRELFKKLSPLAVSPDEIHQLLDTLEQEGLQSDLRTAEAIVRARQGKHGALRIKQDLLMHGIPDEIIQQVLVDVKDDELSQAKAVWAKRFQSLPSNAAERAKQGRYLQNRGFSMAIIQSLLRGDD
ncbi:recombination regulator RecX [Ferrovum sp. PN-J185]|uniref:recombination regulator RecX n=1 Tax=Ferrovum sp. PN-J185 TaxID=1356306 RepID=UPI0007918069|nr:recombination regulator RecX [Ferrovum sp. PN-J185]KXW56370.1 regulatory protein RecX [Ferrovum sp. PN-J185]MCC6069094.1 recombination regulator RecX [Ferrovum sp. PN-J185]MDE1890926.1 recombination regulator RecX [Betaproteobacteria bacterium]MDE2055762.1 recombination regulator RecX [Betaproteobacteria bacterium]